MSARLSVLAAVGSVALLLAPAAGTSAQSEETWTSPTYGFTASWDPSVWEEEPAESLTGEGPDQLDRLLLLGEIGPLYIEGARRYDGVASTCVSEELGLLSNEPDFSDPTRLPDYDADGPDASAGAVEATLTQDSGEEIQVIAYVQCIRAGADSVAIATVLAPVEDFPDHFADAQPVLASIVPAGLATGHDLEFAGLLDSARANAPLMQGESGALAFGPGVMATSESNLSVADFAASATFANPWDGADQPFDFGFAFRHTGTDEHLRLVIDSAGAWTLQNGLETVATGMAEGVRSGAGESNTLEIVARGNEGWFGVNGAFVDRLDLSGRALAGDVLVASGFFSENATVDGETKFTRFSVWPLPAAPGVLEPATFAEWMNEVTSADPAAGPLSGSLVETEGSASLDQVGVSLADFAARIRWANPEGAEPWEIGVAFRDQPDGSHYRLTFDQTGKWLFGIGTGEKSASGAVPSMRLEPGAQNALELIVTGDSAGFAVNGVFVAQLDVSEIVEPGDVWFGTGFDIAATQPDRETRYREFTVWPAEGLTLSGEPGTTTPVDSGELLPIPTIEPEESGPVDTGASSVIAVRLAEIADSGVSGLATVTDVGGEAWLNLVLRGGDSGQFAVIHEGSCADLSAEPAFLLEDVDATGRSKSGLGVAVEDLFGTPLAIAVYEDISTYGQPVACGEIG